VITGAGEMSGRAGDAAYEARAYQRPVSILWWLRRRTYLFFALRELSCLAVAWSVLFLMLLVRAIGESGDAYEQFVAWARTPWVVALNVVAFAFLVLHAITWFNLTPSATVVRLRGQRVRPAVIAGSAYAGWVVVSGLVAWIVLRQ
jgi:fumarate reductase subunit C